MIRTIASVLLLAATCGATTIVAVRSKKEIVIAADSKVTNTLGEPTGGTACKIVEAGGLAFAYAGFARDAESGFSVPEIFAAALAERKRLGAAAKTDAAVKVLLAKLEPELRTVKTGSPVTFREKIEGKTFLRIVIAGFERSKPFILVRLFKFGVRPDGKSGVIVTKDDCGPGCKGEIVTRLLGETEAIYGLSEETKGFWDQGLAVGARKLVEVQIEARAEYVGPPVDILRLTPKRSEWIARKPECAIEK